jgi:hypothetical protein
MHMNSRRREAHHEWEIVDDEDDRPFTYVLTRAVLTWGVQWRGETRWPDGPLTGAAGPLIEDALVEFPETIARHFREIVEPMLFPGPWQSIPVPDDFPPELVEKLEVHHPSGQVGVHVPSVEQFAYPNPNAPVGPDERMQTRRRLARRMRRFKRAVERYSAKGLS